MQLKLNNWAPMNKSLRKKGKIESSTLHNNSRRKKNQRLSQHLLSSMLLKRKHFR